MASACAIRINRGGNYCGHDPQNPRLDLALPPKSGRGGIPQILTVLSKRLTDYYYQPLTLPSLNLANGSRRQQRSCRREACMQLLSCMLKFCDLVTLKVGVPAKEGFVNLSLALLAKHAGLSLSRAERAFRDLRKANIVSSTPICEVKRDGHYRGFPSVKCLSKNLFAVFGLKKWLEKERQKASKRLRKQQKAWAEEGEKTPSIGAIARLKLTFGESFAQALSKGRPRKRTHPPPKDLDRERLLQLKALELSEQHPDWDHERCFKEADKAL